MTLELTAPNKMHLIFNGNTNPFGEKFNEENIKLKRQKIDGSSYAEYYRVIEHVKIEDDVAECFQKIQHILKDILCSSPVIAQLNDKKHDTELALKVMSQIKELPNIELR